MGKQSGVIKSSPIITDSSRLKTYEDPNLMCEEFDLDKLEAINEDESSSSSD